MKKIIILFFIFFSSSYSFAQDGKVYRKETKLFLSFVRENILGNSDSAYSSEWLCILNKDTLYTHNYLYNKHLFPGISSVMPNIVYGWFTSSEKKKIVEKVFNDTAKFFFKANFINRIMIINESKNDISKLIINKFICLSKPIFLRNYTLCVFSYAIGGGSFTILCLKENGKWELLRVLGRNASDV